MQLAFECGDGSIGSSQLTLGLGQYGNAPFEVLRLLRRLQLVFDCGDAGIGSSQLALGPRQDGIGPFEVFRLLQRLL